MNGTRMERRAKATVLFGLALFAVISLAKAGCRLMEAGLMNGHVITDAGRASLPAPARSGKGGMNGR